MIEEQDFRNLVDRLDDRYKRISDCTSDMGSIQKGINELCVQMAEVKTANEKQTWLLRTILAAFVTGIIGAIIYVITKG